ncbi:tRNA exportin type nuclear export protein [Cryptosporidium ubiquitum]|uniref:Exportin-T n=1 Tax=Cryptosporidium ubiquitum TaxID=857276 RepID=A0A1J4MMG7_9CRYT|nr:tRNA exportin type nuclear export protein [Cryptosporidium ubiquitum]OII74053.1 tRNA exportin type nuclear export protein [Cryptosporidium ubiquitum]
MDDLEKAIKTLNSPGSTPSEKLKSLEVCELVVGSSEGWKICLKHFNTGTDDDIRFWSIGSLIKMIGVFPGEESKTGPCKLNMDDKKVIREALVEYLRDGIRMGNTKSYLKNKISELYVTMIYVDYPENWPSAFLDIISLVTAHDWMPDMFIRILCTFDNMIVSNIGMQSAEEISIRRKIKDIMRVNGDLNHIVQAWIFVVSKHKNQTLNKDIIELLSSSMKMMESFIDWIDISYAVNNEVLSIILSFLNPIDSPVVVETLNFLSAILLKGMPPKLKIQLFKDLNISYLVDNQITLNIKNITPDYFQSQILGKWPILENPETIISMEQRSFGDLYKDFCLFLLTFRANFVLKVVNELFFAIKNLSSELESKKTEESDLVAFRTGMEILETLLPSLNIILSIESSEFMQIKQETCKFLTHFSSVLSSTESYISRLSQDLKNNTSFFSNFVSGVLFALLNALKKPDSHYFFQTGGETEIDLPGVVEQGKNSPDFGALFLSLLDLKPEIVCEFMDMIIENITKDIQSMSFNQVDSVSFLIAKFGQASLTEKKKLLKSRNTSLSESKLLISSHYVRFVGSLLKCSEIMYFNCKCYNATESGIHREIFLRNSLLQIFRNFTYLVGSNCGGSLNIWNDETRKILNEILDILLSNCGFLNPHYSISYQSSKSVVGIAKSFSNYLFDYIPKLVIVLRSHETLSFIFKLAEKGSIKDHCIDSFEIGLGSKSLNTICEAIGFLLFSKLKSRSSLSEQQEVVLQYEEIVKPILELSHKLIEQISENSSRTDTKIDLLKWRSAMELVQMISSISDTLTEQVSALSHLWRASLNTILLLARSSNSLLISESGGFQISVLSLMHKFIRIIGPEICNYIVPICNSFLVSLIKPDNIRQKEFQGGKYSEACEEISHLVCHLVNLYGNSEDFTNIFGTLIPEIFLYILKLWLLCWPSPASLCNIDERFRQTVLEDIAFSVEAHQARMSIQLSLLKIINQLSKETITLELLVKLCSTEGEKMNEAKQILNQVILNPVGVTSSFGIKSYVNLVPSAFLFREALARIQNPVLCFLISSLLPSLSTPIHWLEYNGDRHLFSDQDIYIQSVEVITSIYLKVLTFSNLSSSSSISQELEKMGIEVATSFLWFSILNNSHKEEPLLNSQLALFRLLIKGEAPLVLIERNSNKNNKKQTQIGQKYQQGQDTNSIVVPQNVVMVTRDLVLSGTKAAFTQKNSSLVNNPDAISFTRKSIYLFSGYHYFVLLSFMPGNGLLDETFKLLNEISQTIDPQFKQILRKFIEDYQSYVRQVL